jgi:hypothetical protein
VAAALGLLLVLAALNYALTFHNLWPTPWVRTEHQLSAELPILVLLLALWLERGALPGSRARVVLASVLGLWVVVRYLEVTAPGLFGRPVNLYWDVRHLPEVGALLLSAASPGQVALAAVGALAGVGLLVLLARLAGGALLAGLAVPAARRTAVVLAAAVMCLLPVDRIRDRWPPLFAEPVAGALARQGLFLSRALLQQAGAYALPAPAPVRSDLGQLAGADFFLLFAESYGAVAFDRPEYARVLEPAYRRLEAAVRASGRVAVSARVRSPTFGGSSWLAHSSLMSGVWVADEGDYERLLASGYETLADRFRAAGYRTLALLPGMHKAWPEGRFYAFDRVYDTKALDYAGPHFGWWRSIPDQWSLARLHALELAASGRKPALVFFATLNSHSPFVPLAPYEPCWNCLLGGDVYGRLPDLPSRLAEEADWLAMGPAYVRAIGYTLAWLAGYLEANAPAGAVLVVTGDHQPPANVSGPAASWDVPVHVIAPAGPVTERLRSAGFAAGLEPPRAPVTDMAGLRALLLSALDRGGAGVAVPGPAP